MGSVKIRTNKVAVFVAGPLEGDREVQLCQALLIERELAKVAHVTILGKESCTHLYYEILKTVANCFAFEIFIDFDAFGIEIFCRVFMSTNFRNKRDKGKMKCDPWR